MDHLAIKLGQKIDYSDEQCFYEILASFGNLCPISRAWHYQLMAWHYQLIMKRLH